jgi:hypothetical protein
MEAAGSSVTVTYPPDYKVSYSRSLYFENTTYENLTYHTQ